MHCVVAAQSISNRLFYGRLLDQGQELYGAAARQLWVSLHYFIANGHDILFYELIREYKSNLCRSIFASNQSSTEISSSSFLGNFLNWKSSFFSSNKINEVDEDDNGVNDYLDMSISLSGIPGSQIVRSFKGLFLFNNSLMVEK